MTHKNSRTDEVLINIPSSGYVSVPEGIDFNTEFPTYILAFCPDPNYWVATNKRFFSYEYDKEFRTKEEAEQYFREHAKEFYNLENSGLLEYRPAFEENKVYLMIDKSNDEVIYVN